MGRLGAARPPCYRGPVKRPVWLFSLDTEGFAAVPMTTGGLKAYFQRHGATAADTDVEIVHFLGGQEARDYFAERWPAEGAPRARAALDAGLQPVVGFSVYTWNASEFLEAVGIVRRSVPGVRVVAGGPHVQRPESALLEDGIEVVVLGEGELTFQALLDLPADGDLASVAGLAFVRDGQVVRSPERPRVTDLDTLPSALEVIPLKDEEGRLRYPHVAYETSRGCPYRCAFCEWGTGAIGSKMYQHGMARIREDLTRLVDAGVKDIWLCDSNFGALREDLDKAKLVVELKQRTGLPSTFSTSWSKQHNARVQEIVLTLHAHGLLQHYNLALQTLTPQALELSNRKNMRSNQYEPIAQRMVEDGVPIATELIWGLPGDNLADFEAGLDRLSMTFPNINIFGYTLLPGTEFADRRQEYRLETIPVAGYGKAKGEYVVASHTFDRDEGLEGYFLIAAYIILVRGHVVPMTARFVALQGGAPMSPFLRRLLRALSAWVAPTLAGVDFGDRMAVYEHRAEIFLSLLRQRQACFEVIDRELDAFLREQGADDETVRRARAVLRVDQLLCPRVGPGTRVSERFEFDAHAVEHHLSRMRLPPEASFEDGECALDVDHPGGAGEVLTDPDGGSWMRGRIAAPPRPEGQPDLVQLRR